MACLNHKNSQTSSELHTKLAFAVANGASFEKSWTKIMKKFNLKVIFWDAVKVGERICCHIIVKSIGYLEVTTILKYIFWESLMGRTWKMVGELHFSDTMIKKHYVIGYQCTLILANFPFFLKIPRNFWPKIKRCKLNENNLPLKESNN